MLELLFAFPADRERRGKNKGRGKNRNRNSRKNTRRKNSSGGKGRQNSKASGAEDDHDNDDGDDAGERRGCNQVDRSSFNSDLLEFINGEYDNATLGSNRPRSRSGVKGARLASTKIELVDWKFDQLDRDK